MARPRTISDETVSKLIADWRTGNYSQRELADRHKVSTGFVAKHTKGVEQDVSSLVSAGVEYRRGLSEISEQSAHVAHAVEEAVDEKVRDFMFFRSAALRNVSEAMKLQPDSHRAFKDRAETILKGKETVLGKSPETAIQINNNAGSVPAHEMDDDQLASIAATGRR